MAKKTALILSGWGAKGAFQVAVEKYAREEKGYNWDIIYGVSAGAVNGFMLAMEKYQRLWEVWNSLSNDQIYTGGFNLWSVIKLIRGGKSFYDNQPLLKLVQQELDPSQIKKELLVGTVSLVTGQYVEFNKSSKDLAKAILASTAMPVIWPPVDISTEHPSMADGGLRNVTPIGDVLDFEPDEIVIINCGPEKGNVIADPPANLLEIGSRTLEINQNEAFRKDIENFQRINNMVKEAGAHGITLHSAKSGRPIKYYECKVVRPIAPLDDMRDFSQGAIQRSLKAGWERAKAVFG